MLVSPPLLRRHLGGPGPLVAVVDLILAGAALHEAGRDQGDVPVPDADLGHDVIS